MANANIQVYDDLIAAVAKYIKRQDLAAMIPDWIQFAEDYFDKKIYVTARRASYIATPLQAVFPMPSDVKQPIQAYMGGHELDFYPIGWDSQYAGGTARVISNGWQIIGNFISLSVPQLAQVFQLDYYQTLEGLSTTNESNWLLEDAPSIYLCGVLHEGFSYTRDVEKATYWLQKRDFMIESYIDDDTSSRHPAGQLTMRAG
jgi:hypothetical protein